MATTRTPGVTILTDGRRFILRDSNVCGLEWTWEVAVPELGRSVFVIPPEAFKTERPHVVTLNDVAWSIVKAQRSIHPIWLFPFRGRRITPGRT